MKLILIAVVAAATIVGVASRFIFKKTDNIVEEVAEKIIKNKTGHDVDLSPDTPDPNDKKKDKK